MLYIDKKNNIKLTRGDTAQLTLRVKKINGQPYDYSNDLVQFTVKRNTETDEVIFQKTFAGSSIFIEPSDTKDLDYELLVYDVQLITPDNDVYTVIPPRNFILTQEVNFDVSRT